MLKEELVKIKTPDSEEIAVWKIENIQNNNKKNIFLTHGTFSNKKICLGIAKYFAVFGYTCWIMEWRSHGDSSRSEKTFNFETIAVYDMKAVFNYLVDELGIRKIDCITHSGGGVCLTMFLLKNTAFIPKINSIVLFSCQSFGACHNFINTSRILFSKYLSLLLGYAPGKKFGLGPHNEGYYTMKQWFDWNLQKKFNGESDFDYLNEMKGITIPILSICAEGDKFIAPKEGVLNYLNAYKNPNNKFVCCSTKNGFKEDYSHSRIMVSKNAINEIWPQVRDWIGATSAEQRVAVLK